MELDAWIARQARHSSAAMENAISATHLTRRREAFGQSVTPARGSVLASPVVADWNPQPDYFFHWLRDSAIVMRAVAELMEDAADAAERGRWQRHFEDFVRFSLMLCHSDGRASLGQSRHGDGAMQDLPQDLRKVLRPEAEIDALSGDALLAEPRFNPDGTIDIFRWSRPQFDGPALRALACLRFLTAGGPSSEDIARLIRLDLGFTLRHASRPCIGPWEEAGENTHHYYVALVQLGALVHGRAFVAEAAGERDAAEARLRASLERHWSDRHQVYSAMHPARADTADDVIDTAMLLAVLDADLPEGPHSVQDPRMRQTQAVLEALFARELPINRGRPAGQGPALGRSRGDRYFGGGAWYPTTLAAAGLCYRLAAIPGQDRAALLARGDTFMRTLRNFTPADGALSEQIDRETGAQTSARHLTWSYAAFVATARLRAKALAQRTGDDQAMKY